MSTCPCCREKVSDISKRFDPVLGFACRECFEFLLYADLRLSHHGIRGSVANPVRYSPQPKNP